MNDARIIINVSDREHSHSAGISGTWIVPAKREGEEFGMLVVYNARELQDVGNNVKTVHWPSATSVAHSVLSRDSDATAHTMGTAGGAEKWGILLCEANPDIPRELLMAEEEQRAYLEDNRPEIKQKRDQKTKLMLATTVYPPEVALKLDEIAKRLQSLREKFYAECRKLVQRKEIQKAKHNLSLEDARLVSEGDLLWAGNEAAKRNINELHKSACRRLGQERPWCYIAQQLVDCPGCGAKIREDILSCPQCSGWLDEGIEELRIMKPKERAMKMYPERYAEPMTASGKARS
jgi:hypothetical protein